MGRTSIFIHLLRFVLLVLVQVLVFNQLNFLGFINPMVYILFLFWYPIKENRMLFIAIGFVLLSLFFVLFRFSVEKAISCIVMRKLLICIMSFSFNKYFWFIFSF